MTKKDFHKKVPQLFANFSISSKCQTPGHKIWLENVRKDLEYNYVVSYEESHGSGTNLICFREHRSDVSLLFYIPLSWRDIRNEIAVLLKKHKT